MKVKRETIDIVPKQDCYGCTNCSVICNFDAIKIKINDRGFLEPEINYDKCSYCGLCAEVCPVLNGCDFKAIENNDVYAVWSKTDILRLMSTSGGIASSISLKLLERGYNTVGAVYNKNYDYVYHDYCESVYRILDTMGSKYVQSDLSIGLKKAIKKKDNKFVLVGTPCQIAGARNVLEKMKYPETNYYLIDFFCHGIPSYLMWKAYIRYLNQRIGRICSLNLRFKNKDWHEYNVRVIGDKGVYLKNFSEDIFGKLYLSNYCLRDSCYICKYNKYSAADLRIGDFWGEDFENDRKGVSIALPMTEKGYSLISAVDDLEVNSVSPVLLYKSQSIKEGKRYSLPIKNEKFLEALKNDFNIDSAYKKYLLSKVIRSKIIMILRKSVPKRYLRKVKKIIGQ